eukprot:CAMPEP_0174697336 /NCGR_PEP_ID=MMETSP1094-20130205/3229_1 /TAXON_ID=156173 /ORGANISM="Chrysochromulina brevifilum, Strain UTEX LB 985" /LENGTH=264 /DNA_ID=CAMNT_0015894289 /DNA_START=44 /DNA_END=838 /DNA_ORIENTATION=-
MSSPEVVQNIEKARALKEEGNQRFKEGNYPAAMAAYHQIYMYVHGYSSSGSSAGMPGKTTTPVTSEEMAQIRELKVAHHCNLAMCHMKHGPKLQKAKDNCTKALAIDAKNVKALFRRGKCYTQLGELDEAKADLDRVLELEPENKEAVRELRLLRTAFDKQRKKEQKKFAGMFDKMHQDEEMAEADALPAAADATGAPAASSSATGEDDDASAGRLHAHANISKSDGGGYKVNISCGNSANTASGVDVGERVGDVQSFEPLDCS